jgi:type I restriction enzyme, S subunit
VSTSPSHWAKTLLGELGELKLGKMLDKSKNQGHPAKYLRNINVRWFRFDLSDLSELLASEEELVQLSVEDGDLFICEGGEPGRCAVWRGGASALIYQKALHRFRSAGAIVPELLMYRLKYEAEAGLLGDSFTGTTIKHLTRESLSRLQVLVPPLPEQKRIADKLGALVARADACRERLNRVAVVLKRLRKAIYGAASNGTLTEDWRAERGTALEDWSEARVDEISSLIFDGPFGSHLKSVDYTDSGVRVVRLENIAPLRFVEEKRTYISEAKYKQLTRHTLLADDVLFSSFVDEEVRVCLLPRELSGNAINKADCFCIRVDRARCDPHFLALKLASRSTFSALDDVVHGATRPRINLSQLRAIAFRLPSMEEQTEIVRRVESIFAIANAIDARLTAARGQVDRLTPALLAKAFAGELVPQDSDDETATDLLERIRSRSTSGETEGSRRGVPQMSRSKAKVANDMLTRRDVTSTHLTDILKERGALTAEALWKASQLEIDDFYEQLKDEESKGLLRENRGDAPNSPRLLESAA